MQRCQWHKRENSMRYLPAGLQPVWRRKLQSAYEQRTNAAAHTALTPQHGELAGLNVSAGASLAEGLEETLTLHRIGRFEELGPSFKTTNMIESIMAQVEQRKAKVDP